MALNDKAHFRNLFNSRMSRDEYVFDIEPFIGVGKLQFGMSSRQVANAIGNPDSSRKTFLGEVKEYRRENGLVTTYTKDTNDLIEIGFSSNISELQYKGRQLFVEPALNIFDELVREDGSPYETVGFIVLLKLGMTITGFHDGAEEQKAITVFTQGRWDVEKDELKLLVLP